MAQSSHFVHSSVIPLTLLVEGDDPARRLVVVLRGMFQDVKSRGQMAERVQICSPWSRVLRRMFCVADARTVAVLSSGW